jgi:exopolysaccharide biosynthesis polyprenyl glycosylphosphotransferase
VFANQRKRVGLSLAVLESILLVLAFIAAYQTRLHAGFGRLFYIDERRRLLLIAFSILFWLAIGASTRIYEHLDSAQARKIVRATFRQCFLNAICIVLFEYLLRWDLSRSFLSIFFLYAFSLIVLFRINSPRIVGAFQREFGKPYHVLIVGSRKGAEDLGRLLVDGSPFRVEIVGIIGEEEGLSRLAAILNHRIIDEIIFRVDSQHLASLEEVFLLCDEEGIRTRIAADFFPHVNSRMSLDRLGVAPMLTFSAAPDDDLRLVLKRGADVVVSLAGLILLSPLLLLIVILIRGTSPGPAIFRQVRCGLNGRRFKFYKFRSMVQNAEELKDQLTHLNRKTTAFKIPNDPRLTPVGRWLRKFSIDELPQLFNILRGDMSIVGPRPAVPEEVENYQRWQRRRLRMRPGLTCLWAIRGRDELDFDTWMRMDMEYIDNWSLSLDLKILLKSIPYVLTGRGAH